MAIYDVDGSPTTYQPSEVVWLPPDYVDGHDGNTSQSIYWTVQLMFTSDGGILQTAAWTEWAVFNDLVQHTIDLPSHDDPDTVVTYTGVIKIDNLPSYLSINTSDFAMLVGPVDIT